ncbi:MAG: sn-glycerol-3-phosphate ABC transporter ATP-binding protein UgpC [Corynebacteriales bacterium]|nr:sn-glycerol-3-phosphate ABC transporter ATP-binding protein UgpC [Mycobacteriales bacterium]
MAEIVLDKVTKRFRDGTEAVQEIDLTIADKEFLILVGPSGCGKSTTLNMIAGLEDISDGELRIDGDRVNERSPQDRNIAMVFQSYALYPHMTVRENMEFPLTIAKLDKATIKQKIDEAAEILELGPYLDRKPSDLSGGQRQRVAMGRAIVRKPKAFLMDEPLSNLDAKLRAQMRTSISRLQKSLGTTTVYVTHDQTEAMTLGDRIVVMRAGIVQQIGTPQDLYERPANLFVAGFIGSPTMNFLPGELVNSSIATAIGEIPISDRLRSGLSEHGPTGRDVIVGIRPEAFEDSRFVDDQTAFTFPHDIDIVESLGSAKLAYLDVDIDARAHEHFAEIAQESGAEDVFGSQQIVAQLDARSPVREGDSMEISFRPDDIQLFDPTDGTNLTEHD